MSHPLAAALDFAGGMILRPPVGGLGAVFCHGDRGKRRIALTFDDGPLPPGTLELLAVLESFSVKATFFVVGENVQRAPEIVRQAFAAGHIIGNHSMAHRRWSAISLKDDAHISAGGDVVREVIGVRPRLYRAPWGWVTPWEMARLRAAGYHVIGWDLDTFDWKTDVDPGDRIAERMTSNVRPGSIILCHDGWGVLASGHRTETTRAVREFIPQARDLGYEFVTVPELLSIPAYAND